MRPDPPRLLKRRLPHCAHCETHGRAVGGLLFRRGFGSSDVKVFLASDPIGLLNHPRPNFVAEPRENLNVCAVQPHELDVVWACRNGKTLIIPTIGLRCGAQRMPVDKHVDVLEKSLWPIDLEVSPLAAVPILAEIFQPVGVDVATIHVFVNKCVGVPADSRLVGNDLRDRTWRPIARQHPLHLSHAILGRPCCWCVVYVVGARAGDRLDWRLPSFFTCLGLRCGLCFARLGLRSRTLFTLELDHDHAIGSERPSERRSGRQFVQAFQHVSGFEFAGELGALDLLRGRRFKRDALDWRTLNANEGFDGRPERRGLCGRHG